MNLIIYNIQNNSRQVDYKIIPTNGKDGRQSTFSKMQYAGDELYNFNVYNDTFIKEVTDYGNMWVKQFNKNGAEVLVNSNNIKEVTCTPLQVLDGLKIFNKKQVEKHFSATKGLFPELMKYIAFHVFDFVGKVAAFKDIKKPFFC
jgi:hypothetical protein